MDLVNICLYNGEIYSSKEEHFTDEKFEPVIFSKTCYEFMVWIRVITSSKMILEVVNNKESLQITLL